MNSNIFIDNCEFLTVENWKMTQFIVSKFSDSVESITHVPKYLDSIWLWSMSKERGNASLGLKDRGYFFLCMWGVPIREVSWGMTGFHQRKMQWQTVNKVQEKATFRGFMLMVTRYVKNDDRCLISFKHSLTP